MAMLAWPRHAVRTRSFPGCTLHVYRRDDQLVHGPCMSLYVGEVEVMRFDFPPGAAHEHWSGIPGKPRLYYPRSWSQHRAVELGVWNLVHHAKAACRLAAVDMPDRAVLVEAAEWAREELIGECV